MTSIIQFFNGLKYNYVWYNFLRPNDNNLVGLTLESPIFSFSFFNLNEKSEVYDPQIGYTISEILRRFFVKNPSAVLYYICDNMDLKAVKRQKSFQSWFKKLNSEPKKVLIQAEIHNVIYLGVFLMNENKEIEKIENFFEEQMSLYKKERKDSTVKIIS